MFTKKASASEEGNGASLAVIGPPPDRSSCASKSSFDEAPVDSTDGDGVVLVGKGARIIGEISDCTMVDIQGILEGKILAGSVIIREGGGFKGTMHTDHAEVHGVVEGSVVVNNLLDIRSTGTVTADLAYGQLSVEAGGQMSGNVLAKISIQQGNTAGQSDASSNGSDQFAGQGWAHNT